MGGHKRSEEEEGDSVEGIRDQTSQEEEKRRKRRKQRRKWQAKVHLHPAA